MNITNVTKKLFLSLSMSIVLVGGCWMGCGAMEEGELIIHEIDLSEEDALDNFLRTYETLKYDYPDELVRVRLKIVGTIDSRIVVESIERLRFEEREWWRWWGRDERRRVDIVEIIIEDAGDLGDWSIVSGDVQKMLALIGTIDELKVLEINCEEISIDDFRLLLGGDWESVERLLVNWEAAIGDLRFLNYFIESKNFAKSRGLKVKRTQDGIKIFKEEVKKEDVTPATPTPQALPS